MENVPNISIAQRLAIEKQLLREEKYIVHALKAVKEERHALQREGMDLLCLLKDVLSQGKLNNDQCQKQEEVQTSTASKLMSAMAKVPSTNEVTLSMTDEFNIACLDDILSNEVELNLTVPSHNLNDLMPEEEYEEFDADDDFEIEMGMLMNGDKATD